MYCNSMLCCYYVYVTMVIFIIFNVKLELFLILLITQWCIGSNGINYIVKCECFNVHSKLNFKVNFLVNKYLNKNKMIKAHFFMS